jgi:hypothetical protein
MECYHYEGNDYLFIYGLFNDDVNISGYREWCKRQETLAIPGCKAVSTSKANILNT